MADEPGFQVYPTRKVKEQLTELFSELQQFQSGVDLLETWQ